MNNSLFDEFSKNINKLFIKDKTIDVHGAFGTCNLFMSDRVFYDLDQFDIKNMIESLFDCLTDIQKQNLARQLEERRTTHHSSVQEITHVLSDQISDDIVEQVKEYNWNYRFRVCQKCPLEQQEKRNCFRVKDSYKIIKGVRLQQTHCKWLQRARANKFRDLMKKFFRVCVAETFGTDKAYPKKIVHSDGPGGKN